MNEEDRKLYDDTMDKLDSEWFQNENWLANLHVKSRGIRSTQIGALVILLIKLGVIKRSGVINIR